MDFRVLSPKENDVSSRFYSVTSEYLSCNACEEVNRFVSFFCDKTSCCMF